MKAVILSGGQGTRLRPLTYSVPKQLIPVGGRSVLARVIGDIVDAGITEIAIVTSPEAFDAVEALLDVTEVPVPRPEVIVQPEPNGLAAAFEMALPFVGGDDSMLYLGDCLVTGGVGHVIAEHRASGADATILVQRVDDPSRYGIVEVDQQGDVSRLVEKPADPQSDLAIVGVYVFNGAVETYVASVEPSWRGEREITDALQLIVESGGLVRTSRLTGWWIDTGTMTDLITANHLILEDLAGRIEGDLVGSSVSGRVVVEKGATVVDSELIGPVVVASGARVDSSRIGPDTTIDRGAVVRDSEVSSSILMSDVVVEKAHLTHSVLGPRARVSEIDSQGALSIVVGSDASIGSGSASHSG